jgi:putative SOS response-associated peptidase YedK
VCNLYSITRGQQAIRQLARAMNDRAGNMPPLPGIYPDYRAPIVRNQADGRELTMARWGMPSPLYALKGKKKQIPASPMYATSARRIGAGGSASRTDA